MKPWNLLTGDSMVWNADVKVQSISPQNVRTLGSDGVVYQKYFEELFKN